MLDAKGAELKSIHHLSHKLEYLWSANPAYWAKTSPVLFPIVGALKNNAYLYAGKWYSLSRHGFARDKVFDVTEQTGDSITFAIQSDEATLAVYPFHFLLAIVYTVEGDSLHVKYIVKNAGEGEMLFSIGGHPAFKVPLAEGTTYDDYTLRFEKEETAGRWPISKEGLIEEGPQPLLYQTRELPLTKGLFKKDAIVLKHLQSSFVELTSGKTAHGFLFRFDGFPYLGLWAATGADFVCIEPWQGIADSVNADGELTHKEGILSLAKGEEFSARWSVSFR